MADLTELQTLLQVVTDLVTQLKNLSDPAEKAAAALNNLKAALAMGDTAASGIDKTTRSMEGATASSTALVRKIKELDNAHKAGTITQQQYNAELAKTAQTFAGITVAASTTPAATKPAIRPPGEASRTGDVDFSQVDVAAAPTKATTSSLRTNEVVTFAGLTNSLTSGEQGARALQQALSGVGFELKDLQPPITNVNTGVTRFTARVKTANGGMQELTGTINRNGRVLLRARGQMSSFTEQIMRNIVEVAKWSISVGLVYGAIQQFNEAIQIAIKNQARLADITVAMGDAQRETNEIFQDAADVALAVGERVDGVLDGYAQAVRATGKVEDETTRFALATQLLEDSMILSKLSTLDQAKSMDILIAALRQTGRGLDEGIQLLDKWVATTRIATVDVRTLAESFSITATLAENAGVSLEELNGIIAVVAENTQLTATETGNAVRAIISGLKTETAVEVLTKYGIAIRDTTGSARDFLDVLRQVKDLYDAGLISQADLGLIARAIGGGNRRQGQVEALIKNLEDVFDIVERTASTTGDAYNALDTQLQTVETSVNRLNTAFQGFAQVLGQDGGVLETLSILADSLTVILTLTTKLSQLGGDEGLGLEGASYIGISDNTDTVTSSLDRMLEVLQNLNSENLTNFFEELNAEMYKIGRQNLLEPLTRGEPLGGGFPAQFDPDAFPALDRLFAKYFLGRQQGGGVERAAERTTDISSLFVRQAAGIQEDFQPILDAIVAQKEAELQQARLKNEISDAEFRRGMDALAGINSNIFQTFAAIGEEYINLTDGVNTAEEAIDDFADVFIGASSAQLSILVELVTKYGQLRDMLSRPTGAGGFAALGAIGQEFELTKEQIFIALDALQKLDEDAKKLTLPSIVDITDLTGEQKDAAIEAGKSFQRAYLQSLADIDPALVDLFFESLKTLMLQTGDKTFEELRGLSTQFLQQGVESLGLGGMEDFNVFQPGIPSGMLGQLLGGQDYWLKFLSREFGYEPQKEDVNVLFEDRVGRILHLDMLAIGLALDELIEVNKDQVEGIYNLPSDGTFYVPYYGPNYKPFGSGGGQQLPYESVSAEDIANAIVNAQAMVQGAPTLGLLPTQRSELFPGALEAFANRMEQIGALFTLPGLQGPAQGGLGGVLDLFQRGPEGPVLGGLPTEVRETPPIQLTINFDATFQSMMDGRLMSTMVMRRVLQELIKSQSSSSGATVSFALA
jgi:TP901 family phage tail tape measure protein